MLFFIAGTFALIAAAGFILALCRSETLEDGNASYGDVPAVPVLFHAANNSRKGL